MHFGRTIKALTASLLIVMIAPDCFTEEVELERRYARIQRASGQLPDARTVLRYAYEALHSGSYELVGLEDLWAFALKEGRTLFGTKKLWRATGPEETGDMLQQTTIGPWQITTTNLRKYGKKHGIATDWSDSQIAAFLENHPELQAKLAADYIEEAYRLFGKRSPYAIQSYFWLEAFLNKEIGQGPWYVSVLARSHEDRRSTGFYAKQLLLGSRFNPRGLLYWLYITGDSDAITATLGRWKTDGFAINANDLDHCACQREFRQYLLGRLALSNSSD